MYFSTQFCLLWPVGLYSDQVRLKHFFPLWAWEHCSVFTDSAAQPWADHSRISLIKGYFLAYHCLNERMWHWGNVCVVWCQILTLKMALLVSNLLFCPSSIKASLLTLRKWFVFVHRYLFALQIKQDISSGRLTCNDTSAALMVSHIVQCKYLEAVFSFGSRDQRLLFPSHTVHQQTLSCGAVLPHVLIICVLLRPTMLRHSCRTTATHGITYPVSKECYTSATTTRRNRWRMRAWFASPGRAAIFCHSYHACKMAEPNCAVFSRPLEVRIKMEQMGLGAFMCCAQGEKVGI